MKSSTIIAPLALATASSVVAQSAGCGKDPIASGAKTMTVNGKQREYTVKVPDNYDKNNQYRLVFAFHGLNGNMDQIAEAGYYGLDSVAGGSAIFVAPNGINTGWANTGGEDVTFVDQMIETIEGELCVDPAQRFSTGFSYGGAMTYSLACSRAGKSSARQYLSFFSHHADVFKAVAVISGAELSGCDGGNNAVPYLGTHGVADSVLPYESGEQLRDHFLSVNGCAAKDAPAPAASSGEHIKTEYQCSNAPTVWIAHSGDHVPDPQAGDAAGPWLPDETWSFWTEVA